MYKYFIEDYLCACMCPYVSEIGSKQNTSVSPTPKMDNSESKIRLNGRQKIVSVIDSFSITHTHKKKHTA